MILSIIISFYLEYICVTLIHLITSKRTCIATFGLRHWIHEMKPSHILSHIHSICLHIICNINKNCNVSY